MSKVQRYVALGVGAVLAGPVLMYSLNTVSPTATAAQDEPGLSPPGCSADLVRDAIIDVRDLVEVISQWGPCSDCAADLTGDRTVDANDLVEVILVMGPCEDASAPMASSTAGHICAVEDGSFMTADGGCKDAATGLVWSSRNLGEGGNGWYWQSAMGFAEDSTEAGYSDWRLPTIEELQAVIANGAEGHFSWEFNDDADNPVYPDEQGDFYLDLPYWTSEHNGSKWGWAVRISSGVAEKLFIGASGPSAMPFVAVRVAGSPPPPPPPPPPGNCNNDGWCDPGEDCETCGDCEGKQNGPPAGRFCCGNGVQEPAEGDGSICDGEY